jgi:hypothetical protein
MQVTLEGYLQEKTEKTTPTTTATTRAAQSMVPQLNSISCHCNNAPLQTEANHRNCKPPTPNCLPDT